MMNKEYKIVQMNCQDGSSIRMHLDMSGAVEIVRQIDLIDKSGMIESHNFHCQSRTFRTDSGSPKPYGCIQP